MPCRLSLLVLLLLAALTRPAAAAEKVAPEDGKTLKAGKVAADGPALLDYLRKRTSTEKDQEKIAGLIRLLGDDSFRVREKASEDLLAFGPITLPQLRRALNDPDEEIRDRAREGIAAVSGKSRSALTAAVVRVLRVRAPAEAVKVLLAYLPDAENDAVADEVLMALAILGVKEKKVDPLLADALKSRQPLRRAAAGLVLARSGSAEQRQSVQTLLKDADARVRFRAAQGLLCVRDRSSIPVLIALLTDASPDVAARAEELLSTIANGKGGAALRIPLSDNAAQNKQIRNAWEQWWKQNAKIDLTRADVDLPPFNPSLRARATARRFAQACLARDKDQLGKLLETPFIAVGQPQPFRQREKAEAYLTDTMQILVNLGVPVNPAIIGTTTVDQYLKTLQQPREQQEVMKLRRPDVRVVLIQFQLLPGLSRLGGPEDNAVFVRVTNEQTQIIGMHFGGDLGRVWIR